MPTRLAQCRLCDPIPMEFRSTVKAMLLSPKTPDFMKLALGQWLEKSLKAS